MNSTGNIIGSSLFHIAINVRVLFLKQPIIEPKTGVAVGSQSLISRFMEGVFHSRPSDPRYEATWDVLVVLFRLP